ncbi:putative biphenyl-2,3-diol 1,2-dioxygenase III [Cadophora sp. DSE1049]|nr:putative biphenyl-2,3-diol 1,2-dioxygenase III [Cadophora sp. DSE1049]
MNSVPEKSKVLSPIALAHVVLRTNNFSRMNKFYKTFLGGHAAYENEIMSFLTYDEEHHRIALVQVPDLGAKTRLTCGLEHIAFSYANLHDLALAYRQRKAEGITPVCMYYKDPDGHLIETQVDNFDTADEATEFMMSKDFTENPFGTDYDPEELIRRLESGEDEKIIKKRVESGPRLAPPV